MHPVLESRASFGILTVEEKDEHLFLMFYALYREVNGSSQSSRQLHVYDPGPELGDYTE